MRHDLRCGALAMLLSLGAFSAAAQPADAPPGDPAGTDFESPFEGPLDFTTPQLAPGKGAADASKFAVPGAATLDWDTKAGVDYRPPASTASTFQMLAPGALPDRSSGIAWAKVTASGPDLPLSWDKASVETRVDPQEQGKLGMTLSSSLPVGDELSVTWLNSYSMTQPLSHGGVGDPAITGTTLPGSAHVYGTDHVYGADQALRFTFAPVDTTFSLGAARATDDKWVRTLSAEQKLFGGPVTLTGSVSESGSGDISKSIKAGFKRSW